MLEKRSFSLAGHRTSIALEREFWTALEGVAAAGSVSLLSVILTVDGHRAPDQKLASALRLHALKTLSPDKN